MSITTFSVRSFFEDHENFRAVVYLQVNGNLTPIAIDQHAFIYLDSTERSMEAVFRKHYEFFEEKIIDFLNYKDSTGHIQYLEKS